MLAVCLSSLLLITNAAPTSAPNAATIDDLLAMEGRARKQRDTPAPAPASVAAPLEYLYTSFEVEGIFGIEGQLQADVRYNGEAARVAMGDRIGPCVVAQIAGTLGKGVQLQLAPLPSADPASVPVKTTGKSGKPAKPAKPRPASLCPTAYWTEPRKPEPANVNVNANTAYSRTPEPVVPALLGMPAGMPTGIPAATPAVIPLIKKN
ncbi:MAG: hypothetical protein ORN29_09845 [Rhodoferax sp.]|nr:hypothetical protein [Rhodoferax sp.]